MAVLIEGVEIPKDKAVSLILCSNGDVYYNYIKIAGKTIEVPEPYGRLIDADSFTKDECNNCDGACEALPCDCLNCEADCRCDFMKDIADAPTIIPASEKAKV